MDIWTMACPMPAGPLPVSNPPVGTEQQLAMNIVGLIRAAQSPVILVGTEIQRYELADKVADLISKLGVRWATALLAKSTLPEQGAGWLGVYDPPHSDKAVQRALEQADLLVTLGCVFPNGYAALVRNAFGRLVQVYDGKVRIRGAAKQVAELSTLLLALFVLMMRRPPRTVPGGMSPCRACDWFIVVQTGVRAISCPGSS
jgi:indolepyruvate decarboxylase